MAYQVPAQVPMGRLLSGWLREQLVQIAAEVNEPNPEFLTLQALHAAPARLYDGLTVYADGSDWDPGSGEGIYTYYNSTWNKLG